jgi:hypothetical protein
MTEQEWLACSDPQHLLTLLRRRISKRKLWLFAIACCRRVMPLYPKKPLRHAIERAELFAD